MEIEIRNEIRAFVERWSVFDVTLKRKRVAC